MGFSLGSNSLKVLGTVDPKMQAVVKKAIGISEVDFAVVQGKRTLEEQQKLYGQGRTATELKAAGVPEKFAQPTKPKVTWTLKSNHLSGEAVDLAPYLNGKLDWDDNNKKGLWPKIASAMKHAAIELGIRIEWGGDWIKTVDRPHFELS